MSRKKTKSTGITYDKDRKCYYAFFEYGKNEEGKRVRETKTFDTYDEAKKARDKFLAEKEDGKVTMPSDITFGEVLDRWLENKSKKRAKTTTYNYKNIVENHIKPVLGDIPVQNITVDDVEDYYILKAKKNPDAEEGLSLNTLRRHLEVMKGAFVYAKRRKVIYQAPTEVMESLNDIIGYADTDFEHVILEIEELKAFLAAIEKKFFPYWIFYCCRNRSSSFRNRWFEI